MYLEPAVRESFLNACVAAQNHASLLQDRTNVKAVKDNWAEITGFPKVVFAAIQLPGLTELEAKSLRLDTPPVGVAGG